MNKKLYGDSYGEQFRKYEEKTVELEKKIKKYKKQIYLKEKALARIKRDNENLLDQNAMYEFFYEGNGFYKRGLNNSIMIADYIEKLEKENRTLEGCLLAEQEHALILEKQIEKMKCCYNCSKWNDGECSESPEVYTMADFECETWELKE